MINIRIERLQIFLLDVPLGGEVFNPRIIWHRKQSVLVRLICDQGYEGWGECWCFDSSADALIRFIQTDLAPYIVGRTINVIGQFWTEMWDNTALSGRHGMTAAGLSGIEVSLWDISSQRAARTLGEEIASDTLRNHIPVYASSGLYRSDSSLEALAQELSCHVNNGFRRVKIKIGGLSFAEDVARLRTARAAVGKGVGLIVDAVYSLDRESALRWLPIWAECGVEAVQAPFPSRNWSDMVWLNRDCGMPVLVFEAENRIEVFRALLEAGGIGLLQFSPIAVGGVTPSRELIALAEKAGIGVTLQCSSTWFAEMLAFQIARGHGAVEHVELHTLHRGLFDAVDDSVYHIIDGTIQLSDTPGLGFSPPLEKLRDVTEDLPDFKTSTTNVSTLQKSNFGSSKLNKLN